MGLRSPELIFGGKPSKDQDVWSFGCLLFEFITGGTLFAVEHCGDYDDDNDDHLLQLFDIIGNYLSFFCPIGLVPLLILILLESR